MRVRIKRTVIGWTFPFLWVPELSLCLSHSNSRLTPTQLLLAQEDLSRMNLSKSRYNWQSGNTSRFRAHSGTCDQILLSVRRLLSESCCRVSVGHPLWQEVGSVICQSQSIAVYQCLHQGFTFHVFYSSAVYVQYIQSFFQSQLGTADYALLVNIS
jgi:hypothetical protein